MPAGRDRSIPCSCYGCEVRPCGEHMSGLTECEGLALELAPLKIRVNAIALGTLRLAAGGFVVAR